MEEIRMLTKSFKGRNALLTKMIYVKRAGTMTIKFRIPTIKLLKDHKPFLS
jgi:hypothetical protein